MIDLLSMPRGLRWIWFTSVLCVVGVVRASVPAGVIGFDGASIATRVWWSSGAGVCTCLAGLLLATSAHLIVKRSRYARAICAYGFFTFTVAMGFAAVTARAPAFKGVVTLVTLAAVSSLVALYLFKSNAVRRYFDEAAQHSTNEG